MPFKLKLKKSRQYTVSSKNLFVLSVELLDNTTVECTLSSQSLGQECLNNVCQRLGLQQPQYFGLKFLSKKGTYWWVDLQRPLKKQLDKYALESSNLLLGVMFFVSDVNILHDEVTRYHYFLQLKSDVLEGRLHCNEDQTVLLASYSLQAEFGDHDPERHTTEYLTNFGLLPKQMVQGKENQEAILEHVILHHRTLQGLSQQLAEVYYIMEAQHLNGYGLECFAGKEQSSNALIIGISLKGIYIWYLNNVPSLFFPWNQIVNLVHHKRCFGIEHRNSHKVLQIFMEDSNLAKYVWNISIQQHRFYTTNEAFVNSFDQDSRHSSICTNPSIPLKILQNNEQPRTRATFQTQESQESLDDLGVYNTNNGCNEIISNSTTYNKVAEEVKLEPVTTIAHLETTMPPISTNSSISNIVVMSANSQLLPIETTIASSNIPHMQQISSSDVSIHHYNNWKLQGSNPLISDVKNSSSLLPLYRQAPDYETAVKLKYNVQRCQDYVSAPNLHPPVHTYSSPDLASQTLISEHAQEQLPNAYMMYQFKPPPPYPYKQRSSSSTPDLTRNHKVLMPSSSPDMIFNKALINCSAHVQNSKPSFQIATSHPVQLNLQKNIAESYVQSKYEPSISCAKLVTNNVVSHQTIASSQNVHAQNNQSVHLYQNYKPVQPIVEKQINHIKNSAQEISSQQPRETTYNPDHNLHLIPSSVTQTQNESSIERKLSFSKCDESHTMGPMLVAAMNGLSLSCMDMDPTQEEKRTPRDARIQALENKLTEGQLFLEFECIIKKKPNADFSTAILPENMTRNRFKDVFPYEENRVRLTPTNENKTGYINASHLSISVGGSQRFYIAAQGPLPNTLYSFWQMIWEHHVSVIVMLTEVQEQGRDKCFPYWPQEDGNKLQIGEFQIVRNFSMSSPTYITSSLSLCHVTSHQQRSVWHIQYTDWPDHSCPQDVQGFIAFMSEVDAVRRHASNNPSSGQNSPSPIVVHCSAGVGRSGAVILCDIMLYTLDHNQPIDLPKVLTHLRLQRMLTVQTLAQYRFVYVVLIQYLKNSRLI